MSWFTRNIMFAVLLASNPSFGAQIKCKYLFREDDRVSQAVRTFQQGEVDTTSLRQEVKYVVKTADLKKMLEALERVFGTRLGVRELPPPGYANVTSTQYMKIGKYFQGGKKLSTKVRFRKYFTRKLEDVNWSNLKVHPDLIDKSWLELKIDHPDFDNVVFKPRLLIYDRDIQFISNSNFLLHRNEIQARLLQLNPNKSVDVIKFIEYFDALYTTPHMMVENMFAKTEYERTSYSLKLNNPADPSKKVDIQITLDESIHLTKLKNGKNFDVYKSDETVVEVKVPLKFSNLGEADIALIPELAEVKKFIETLDSRHVPDYAKNSGKMSKIEKDAEDTLIDTDWP